MCVHDRSLNVHFCFWKKSYTCKVSQNGFVYEQALSGRCGNTQCQQCEDCESDMCPPQSSCVRADKTACNRCRPRKCAPVRWKSCQASTCPLTALHTHLTRNKVDNTTLTKPVLRQKSHREPYSSAHWVDRLTPQQTEEEVWVWQPTATISSCHYLPSHSQLCSRRQLQKHCMQANIHNPKEKTNTRTTHTNTHSSQLELMPRPLLLIVTHCQVARWVLSIEPTEISILATTNSGNVSLSIWLELREEVHDAEGGSPSSPNTSIYLNLMFSKRQ